MDRGEEDPAEIAADEIVTRETIRLTTSIEIEPDERECFERRLDEFGVAIAQALGFALGPREGVGFLRYRPGGFYLPHRDRGDVAGWPAASRRAASVIVFLNSSRDGDGQGEFEGGTLCLYSDHGTLRAEVPPEAGLLVAFPAGTLHEVVPVTAGIRDVAVDWFYDA